MADSLLSDPTAPSFDDPLVDRPVALLADLEHDHATLAAKWLKLRPLLVAIAAGQRANLAPKQVADLTATYDAHIAKEERDLIPLAAAAFDAPTIAEIGKEMAARRGVDPTGPRQGLRR